MQKRKLSLDKEIMTSPADIRFDGGTEIWCVISRKIIEIVSISVFSVECPPPGDGSGETCNGESCGTGCTGPELC